jgi:hypothetical protein
MPTLSWHGQPLEKANRLSDGIHVSSPLSPRLGTTLIFKLGNCTAARASVSSAVRVASQPFPAIRPPSHAHILSSEQLVCEVTWNKLDVELCGCDTRAPCVDALEPQNQGAVKIIGVDIWRNHAASIEANCALPAWGRQSANVARPTRLQVISRSAL